MAAAAFVAPAARAQDQGPGALPDAADTGGRAWRITPRIEASETFTDNASQFAGNGSGRGSKRNDFITTLAPGVRIVGASRRVQADLDYSLQFDKYAKDDDLDSIVHNLTYVGVANPLGDSFFIDSRAFVADQSATGATPAELTGRTVPNDRVSTATFQVSPYYRSRLGGDWATTELRYSLTESLVDRDSDTTSVTTPGNALTNAFLGTIGTGERFGRVSSSLTTQYVDTDADSDGASSTRKIIKLDNGYAITPAVSVLFGFGYQDVSYDVPLTTDLSGLTWNVGMRFAPTERSHLSISYGRSEGFNSAGVDGSVALGPLTRLIASYTQSVGTLNELLGQNLGALGRNNLGQSIDTRTGLPFNINDQTLPFESAVFRDRQMLIGATHALERDSFTLTASRTERETVSTPSEPDQSSTGVSFSWQRELNPLMNLSVVAGYQRADRGAGFGNEDVVNFGTALSYTLTETTTASLAYTRFDRFGGDDGAGAGFGGLSENAVTLTIRKTF